MGRAVRLTAGATPRWVAPLAWLAALAAFLAAQTPFADAAAALRAAVLGGAGALPESAVALAAAAWRGALVLAAGGALAFVAEDAADARARPGRSLAVLAAAWTASLAAALVLLDGAPWPLEPTVGRQLAAVPAGFVAAALALRTVGASRFRAVALAVAAALALWWWCGHASAGPPEAREARLHALFGGAWLAGARDVWLATGAAVGLLAARRWLTDAVVVPVALALLVVSAGPLPLAGAAGVALTRSGALRDGALWSGAVALACGAVVALLAPGTALPAGLLTLAVGSPYLVARGLARRAETLGP